MDGILICGVVLAAVMIIRSQSQEAETWVFAAVRNDSNDDGAAAFTSSSSVSLFEHSSLSSDDESRRELSGSAGAACHRRSLEQST